MAIRPASRRRGGLGLRDAIGERSMNPQPPTGSPRPGSAGGSRTSAPTSPARPVFPDPAEPALDGHPAPRTNTGHPATTSRNRQTPREPQGHRQARKTLLDEKQAQFLQLSPRPVSITQWTGRTSSNTTGPATSSVAEATAKKSVSLVSEHRHHGRRLVDAREDECAGCLETGRRI